jgi:hypothetical protein
VVFRSGFVRAAEILTEHRQRGTATSRAPEFRESARPWVKNEERIGSRIEPWCANASRSSGHKALALSYGLCY